MADWERPDGDIWRYLQVLFGRGNSAQETECQDQSF